MAASDDEDLEDRIVGLAHGEDASLLVGDDDEVTSDVVVALALRAEPSFERVVASRDISKARDPRHLPEVM